MVSSPLCFVAVVIFLSKEMVTLEGYQVSLQYQPFVPSSSLSGFEVACVVKNLPVESSRLRISLYCPSTTKFPCFQACIPLCGSGQEMCPELVYLRTVICGGNYDPVTQEKKAIFRFVSPPEGYFYAQNGFRCEYMNVQSDTFSWTTSAPVTSMEVATGSGTGTTSSTSTSVSPTTTTSSREPSTAPPYISPTPKRSEEKGRRNMTVIAVAATGRLVNLSDVLVAVLVLLGTVVALVLVIFTCIRWVLIRHYTGNRNKILMADVLCMRQTIESERHKQTVLKAATSNALMQAADRASIRSNISRRSQIHLSTGGGSQSVLDASALYPLAALREENGAVGHSTSPSQSLVFLPVQIERWRNQDGTVQWRPLSIVEHPNLSHIPNNVTSAGGGHPLYRSATHLAASSLVKPPMQDNYSNVVLPPLPKHRNSKRAHTLEGLNSAEGNRPYTEDQTIPLPTSGNYVLPDEYDQEVDHWNRSSHWPDSYLPSVTPSHSTSNLFFRYPPDTSAPNEPALHDLIPPTSYHGTVYPYAEDLTTPMGENSAFHLPTSSSRNANPIAGLSLGGAGAFQKTKKLSRSHSRSLQQGSRIGSHEDILEEEYEA